MGIFDRIKGIVRANQGSASQPFVERTLTNMQVGDILTHDLVDYKVEGVNVYHSGSQVRYGYLLANGSERRYLLVEQKETLRAFLLETISARLENPEEINYEMVFEGVAYYEAARGESSVMTSGSSSFSNYDPVYWWLHLSDDNRAMLFEWQKGETVIRVGQMIKPYECMILAGSE